MKARRGDKDKGKFSTSMYINVQKNEDISEICMILRLHLQLKADK